MVGKFGGIVNQLKETLCAFTHKTKQSNLIEYLNLLTC